MPKFKYQIFMESGEGERDWYSPPGLEHPEFDDAQAAIFEGVRKYPDHEIRAKLVTEERPCGLGYTPLDFTDVRPIEPHQMRPIGSVRAAVWTMVRGISDPRTWRQKCSRCGETSQAHWAPTTILTCRRFKM